MYANKNTQVALENIYIYILKEKRNKSLWLTGFEESVHGDLILCFWAYYRGEYPGTRRV